MQTVVHSFVLLIPVAQCLSSNIALVFFIRLHDREMKNVYKLKNQPIVWIVEEKIWPTTKKFVIWIGEIHTSLAHDRNALHSTFNFQKWICHLSKIITNLSPNTHSMLNFMVKIDGPFDLDTTHTQFIGI